MPFGLDFKSVFVGALIGYLLIPFLLGLVMRRKKAA